MMSLLLYIDIVCLNSPVPCMLRLVIIFIDPISSLPFVYYVGHHPHVPNSGKNLRPKAPGHAQGGTFSM